MTTKTLFKVQGTLHFIDAHDVLYIHAQSAYTIVKLASAEEIRIARNLKYVHTQFYGHDFLFRTHRSFVVNLLAVKKLMAPKGKQNSSIIVQLSSGAEVLLSRKLKQQFLVRIREQGVTTN
jgi:DNA-binding LytR/AlgR family response regulator